MIEFPARLAEIRPSLLRTARLRLRNPDWAADAVSETLLAALQNRPDFADASRWRAWVFGILRHKIADQLRLHLGDRGGQVWLDQSEADPDDIHDCHPWSDPVIRLGERQFIQALQRQLERLPRLHARAFVMRECLGDDTEAICEQLSITPGNLGVVLHRTRRRLRDGLAQHGA